jgi:hypothetical protein
MRLSLQTVLMAAMGFLVPACASSPTPPVKAAQAEQLDCGASVTPQQEARLVERVSVLHSDPLYLDVNSGRDGLEHRLNGARIVVLPPPAATTEDMTRALRCHSAQAVLGQVDESLVPNDPFWLANNWLDIKVVDASGTYAGNYLVLVSADDIDKNVQVLARANAFAEAHPAAPGTDVAQ